MREWLRIGLQILGQLLGLSALMASNRAEKIPMQEPAIREKAETTAIREDNKQERLRIAIPIERVEAHVRTLGLRNRSERQLISLCEDYIRSNRPITALYWCDKDGLEQPQQSPAATHIRVDYTEKDVAKFFLY